MPLRTNQMKTKYTENQVLYENFHDTKNFEEDKERIIHSYEHWDIITNLFPYDKIAEVHDMLVPKRVFGKMSECNKEEWAEYKIIISQFEADAYYDAILENFSKNKSVSRHLHIHLIILKTLS
ncbi:MAG: diadenosine tetraphosphate (Ap4A) HIT family hydrolase [Acidimicrobiales bacterium]|jgi:diadenosine tetraphosphate (Ap4A) HIT family hydrolase